MQLKKWIIAFSALAISSTSAMADSGKRLECEFEQGKKGDGIECVAELRGCFERDDVALENSRCVVDVECTDGFDLWDKEADSHHKRGALHIKAKDFEDGHKLKAEIAVGKRGHAEMSTYVNRELVGDFFGKCHFDRDEALN